MNIQSTCKQTAKKKKGNSSTKACEYQTKRNANRVNGANQRWLVHVNVTGWEPEHWFLQSTRKLCMASGGRWYQVGTDRRAPENGVNESNQVPVTQTGAKKCRSDGKKSTSPTDSLLKINSKFLCVCALHFCLSLILTLLGYSLMTSAHQSPLAAEHKKCTRTMMCLVDFLPFYSILRRWRRRFFFFILSCFPMMKKHRGSLNVLSPVNLNIVRHIIIHNFRYYPFPQFAPTPIARQRWMEFL